MVVQADVQIYSQTQTPLIPLMNKVLNFGDLSKYRGELMGLAILFVVMFHVWMPKEYFFFPLRRLGNVGVDMFLFLSGMGLWYSWLRSRLGKNHDGKGGMDMKQSLKHFFFRRYLRIYPVWFIVASIFYIWKYIEEPGGGYSPDIPNLIANILFNWSFWRADDLTFWYVPATMMLYTFAPFYMELIRRYPTYRWLPAAFVLIAAMVQYVPLFHENVGHIEIFFSRIPIFFIGINAGEWVMQKKELEKESIWLILFIFGISLWLSLRLEFIGHSRFPLFMERLVYIPLTVTALLLECWLLDHLSFYAKRCFAFLGTISLEIYLVHIEFILKPLGKFHLGYSLTTVCVLLISIPTAWLLHWIIDKVITQRLKHFS